MVQVIKNVKHIDDGIADKSLKYASNETVYFDENDVFLEESGGCVSNNLLGISSTLGGIINMDGVLLGANEISCDVLSSLTGDILNGE